MIRLPLPKHLPVAPLLLPLRVTPAPLQSRALALGANLFLRHHHADERLRELDGKRVCLSVTDVPVALYFAIRGGLLRPGGDTRWDVRIAGRLVDFLTLATRAEDPDTLFFNRRLAIEGDTETGVHIKNILDAIELTQLERLAPLVRRLR